MTTRRRVGRRFLILIIAVLSHSATLWAQAPPAVRMAAVGAVAAPDPEASAVRLLVGRSTVIDVGSPISRVSLTSADIADALVTSPSQLLVNGKMPGTISMFVWDRGGVIRRYEVTVQRDLSQLNEQIRQLFPKETMTVKSNGKNIVLSGSVSNKDVIDKAIDLASGFVDKKDEIVSLLQLQENAPSNQVLLRVRFAEVSRSALTELGSSFFTSPLGIKNNIARVTTQQFAAPGFDELQASKGSDFSNFGSKVTGASGKLTFSDFLNFFLFNEKYDLGMMVRALQTRGLFQSLAEPNLVAESGKEASFLAGGEIPIPIAQPSGGSVAITIVYKEFGVRLHFTPTVTGDRVHLKVKPEVSTLDFNNAITISGFRIPALSTRRTETELELQNGQTFAIAGLMNNTMTKSLQKVPGIGDIPILGLLFRSEAAQKERTELVVMITPQILPRNSSGVTQSEPRLQEPYLPAQPDKKTLPPPPPAFQQGRPGQTPRAAAQPEQPARPSAADAANAVSALTPSVPKPMNATPGTTPPATAAGPAATSSPAAATRPLTADERRALDRARQQESQQSAAAKVAAARQAQLDRDRAEKARDLQDKLAKEQARRDAENAKKQAEIDRQRVEAAKKQAEIDKKHQKAIDEAAAKLKAAEAAYQAELAKKKDKDKEKDK